MADTAYFGPEAEFFIFDDVKYKADPYNTGFKVDSTELPSNSDRDYDTGNSGHHIPTKGGYFPVPPLDSAQDIRGEMLSSMALMGVGIEKHHHEVASAQHELGIKFQTLVKMADHLQTYKYCIHNVAHAYGKTATFMPKPVYGDNGSGMHVHQSLWKGKTPVFAGNKYNGLSDQCLWYIGGIIKHAARDQRLHQPDDQFLQAPGAGLRGAGAARLFGAQPLGLLPHPEYSGSPKGKRVEVRFPDPLANPYLAFAAMLMAGLDGIKNKINPGAPSDKDLYHLPEKELKKIPTVCGSLREALSCLDDDRGFLTKGGVFTDDMIDSYIELKMQEVIAFEHTPHPIEYAMYYSN